MADPVVITNVTVAKSAGLHRFDVTVLHPDTGEEHYADQWDVVSMDGEILGSRTLFHPHVHEQPFTRSLLGVKIDPWVAQVQIRAHCSRDGWTSDPFVVDLN